MAQQIKVRANHSTGYLDGKRFQCRRCGNCVPKGGHLDEAPEMIPTANPDGYICGKGGRALLWYVVAGGLTLDSRQ